MVKPPSRNNVWPMTKDELSEHSHNAAAAASSGLPILPIGCWDA